ncbi:MAG: TolC family protein [Bacteroidales bacterium]
MKITDLKEGIAGFLFALILFLILSPLGLYPQDSKRQLSLDEAISISRKQSPDALLAKHRFRSNYWQYRSYQASYLPSLTLYGTLPDFNRSIRTISTVEGEVFSPQTNNMLYGGVSVNQRIGLTGGTLSLNSNVARLDNFYESPDTTITQFSSSLINITYRQPIFQYNAFKWERVIEPMKYEEAKRRYLEDMEQVAVVTTNSFFSLLLAQIRMQIALISQANYDTLYKIAVGRYNLGKIAENDLLQLELQYLRANADVREIELEIENQLFRFKSYLRIQDESGIELLIPDDFEPFTVDAARAVEEARNNYSGSIAFGRRLLEAESEVARAKLNGRFDAELFAVYGLTNNAAEFNNLGTNPLDQQQFRMGISIPILDWGVARGRIKMAESNQEVIRTGVEQEMIDFDQEVFLKVARFNMQYDQILIAAKSDTVAKKGYEITKARYLIDRITITDLNIAQAEANSSKSNYINVLWTYWRNYYDLRRLTLYDFKENRPLQVDYRELL